MIYLLINDLQISTLSQTSRIADRIDNLSYNSNNCSLFSFDADDSINIPRKYLYSAELAWSDTVILKDRDQSRSLEDRFNDIVDSKKLDIKNAKLANDKQLEYLLLIDYKKLESLQDSISFKELSFES